MEKKKTDWQVKAWIAGPIVALACFMVFMTSLVMKTRGNVPELVQKDYYAEDLKSEEILTEYRNAHGLSEQVKFQSRPQELSLQIPSESFKSGEVQFYRASDSRLDQTIELSLSESGTMSFPTQDFADGKWKVVVRWTDGKKYYRFRQNFFVEM